MRANKPRTRFSAGLRLALSMQQKGRCPICGLPLQAPMDVHHIYHHCRGGSDAPRNLQLVHADCNQARGVDWL